MPELSSLIKAENGNVIGRCKVNMGRSRWCRCCSIAFWPVCSWSVRVKFCIRRWSCVLKSSRNVRGTTLIPLKRGSWLRGIDWIVLRWKLMWRSRRWRVPLWKAQASCFGRFYLDRFWSWNTYKQFKRPVNDVGRLYEHLAFAFDHSRESLFLSPFTGRSKTTLWELQRGLP